MPGHGVPPLLYGCVTIMIQQIQFLVKRVRQEKEILWKGDKTEGDRLGTLPPHPREKNSLHYIRRILEGKSYKKEKIFSNLGLSGRARHARRAYLARRAHLACKAYRARRASRKLTKRLISPDGERYALRARYARWARYALRA